MDIGDFAFEGKVRPPTVAHAANILNAIEFQRDIPAKDVGGTPDLMLENGLFVRRGQSDVLRQAEAVIEYLPMMHRRRRLG